MTDLCRIADFFDVSTDFLLGRTEDRQSHCRTKENLGLLQGISFLEALDLLISIREREKKRAYPAQIDKAMKKTETGGDCFGVERKTQKN